MKSKRVRKCTEYAVFVAPAVILFVIVLVIPFGYGAYLSLREWNGISPESTFVGLQNYFDSFKNANFLKSLSFTLRFSLVSVLSCNLLGFGLAYALTLNLKLRNMLRTVYFIPQMIGGLVAGFIWRFIYDTSYKQIILALGLDMLNFKWFSLPQYAFAAVCITFTWQYSGYLMVIYIAALQGVPEEITDAARIDGASAGQCLRHVVLPMIRHAFTICLFVSLSTTFKSFDLIMSLTAGGPFGTTSSLAYHIYSEAFTYHRYGLGSAQSVLFFLFLAIITSLQVSLMKRKEVEA